MAAGSLPTAIRRLVSDRASRLVAGIGLSLVLCLVCLGLFLCADLRRGAWRDAERNADNLRALIEGGVGREIGNYDRSLREASRLAARPDIAALEPEIRRLALFDSPTRGGGLGSVTLTDAEGQVRFISDPSHRTFPSLADRPEFTTHRSDTAAGLIVSRPDRSRITGRPVVRMTRRIENPDGSFAGIVCGVIYLDYFQSLFRGLRVEDGITVNLIHRDGTLLVQAPFHAGYAGRSIAEGAPYRHYRTHVRGVYLGQSHLDGVERLYAFANLDELPLIVAVAVDTDSIRASWIYRAGIVAALILGLSVLTSVLTILLQREVARRAAREASSEAANAELALLARTDGLTGLPNRRCYDEVLGVEWQRAVRSGTPLALLIVDADHFKQFNDRFGHHRGDAVLKAVADCLRKALGPGGLSFRIGGEEFALILPGLGAEAAQSAAERIRRAVVNLQIAHAPEVGGVATVSVGLACARPRAGEGSDALFAAADAALYAAKTAGRNRVRAVGPSGAEPSPLARRA